MIEEAEKSGAKTWRHCGRGHCRQYGHWISHVCNNRGYETIIYMPDNQSQEKVNLPRTLGAKVRVVPNTCVTPTT